MVDRDPGPAARTRSWRRRGVMQFAHPHYFRHLVRLALQDRLPDVWEQLLAAGGVPANFEGAPELLTGLQCRRSTFERVLWHAAAREPRLTLRTGLVRGLVRRPAASRASSSTESTLAADRVLCATGRGSSLGDELRAPGRESACGFSYVARVYRARTGAPWPTWALSGTRLRRLPVDPVPARRPDALRSGRPAQPRHRRCRAAADRRPSTSPPRSSRSSLRWTDPESTNRHRADDRRPADQRLPGAARRGPGRYRSPASTTSATRSAPPTRPPDGACPSACSRPRRCSASSTRPTTGTAARSSTPGATSTSAPGTPTTCSRTASCWPATPGRTSTSRVP